jgi:Spy/CpxP family protein refolding chaperone
MRKQTIIILVVLALVVSAGLAVAVGPAGKAKCGAGMGAKAGCPLMGGKMTAELGLTDSQIAQMKSLHQEFLDVTKATRDQMAAKKKEMADLWTADELDVDKIKATAADISVLMAEVRDPGIDCMIKCLNILTPDQRTKVKATMKNRPDSCPCPGCPMGIGPGMGCGVGFGAGPGMGAGMGAGMGNCPKAK